MSLLRVIRAQLGLSNTASQNFTLTAEAADGTMKLARGNAGGTTQNVFTVDATGKAGFPQGFSSNTPLLEIGQTWQNMTASRAFSTNYTNSTSRPIEVSVSVYMVSGQGLQLITDGGIIICRVSGNSGANLYQTLNGRIPPGSSYQVNYFAGSGSILDYWAELR